MQITAIILAGGKSSRMGTDKVLLKVNEKTLLEQVIELVKPICETVLISSNNPAYEKFGFNIIPDEIKDCGPIGGIYSCLKKSETDWNFIISVDSPFVEESFIRYLISVIDNSDAIIPIHENGKEPLIALYHKNCLVKIEKMLDEGHYKMHNLLKTVDAKFVDSQNWVEKNPDLFRNLNCPEDFYL
jgi:molybdopterin-guanine dinucleotide biosynthesis protein A